MFGGGLLLTLQLALAGAPIVTPNVNDDDDDAAGEDDASDTANTTVSTPRAPPAPPTTTTVRPGAATAAPVGGGTAQELLRRAPGVALSQHAGQGKAHQIFLRGFDAEHGQDVEVTAGGVPVNDVAHVHGQGYADLSFLVPEVVQGLRVRHGPYDVRQGDFATAGSFDFDLGLVRGPGAFNDDNTVDNTVDGFARGSVGSFGFARGVAGVGKGTDGRTFAVVEAARGDGFGPARSFMRASALGQAVIDVGRGSLRVLAGSAAGNYDSAGVVPAALIEGGGFPRDATLDERQGGDSARHQGLVEWSGPLDVMGQPLRIETSAYAVGRHNRLRHNFTGALLFDDGDFVAQRHDALTLGATSSVAAPLSLLGQTLVLELDGHARHDAVTSSQRRLNAASVVHTREIEARLNVLHSGAWLQALWRPLPSLALRGGLRGELLSTTVTERGAARQAQGGVLCPRLVASWEVLAGLQLVAAYGQGFRTPQPRSLGQAEVAPLTLVHSSDVGVAFARGGITASLTAFGSYVEVDRVFDHVAARNLFLGPTVRAGLVADAAVALPLGLRVGASSTLALAQTLAGAPVPYSAPLVARAELSWRGAVARVGGDDVVVGADLFTWLVGPRPLPFAQQSRPVAQSDGALSATFRRITLSVEALNLFDVDVYEGEYVYASRFVGVGDGSALPQRHVAVAAPRLLQLTLTVGL